MDRLAAQSRDFAFLRAAASGHELYCAGPHGPTEREALACLGCGRCVADDPLAFQPSPAPTVGPGEALPLYCDNCRPTHLGPPCRACGLAAPRTSAVLAGDCWFHHSCLRCSEPGCALALGDFYYDHRGKPYCAEHHTKYTAERCAKCDGAVGRGVSALGRAWHNECFTCSISGAALGAGTFYLDQGKPIAPGVREHLAPRCAECGEPATADRVWAMSR